jgi:hypothetical protein
MKCISRLLAVVVLLVVNGGCRVGNTSVPEEVRDEDLQADLGERTTSWATAAPIPGVGVNTLWRFEAQFVDENGNVLSTREVKVLNVLGEWRSDLAPMTPSKGWEWFRSPGLFAGGEKDLAAALRVAPAPLMLDVWNGIHGINETEWVRPPGGAAKQRVYLLEYCPVTVRRMRQFHWRPRGQTVVDMREVKEEMRWREYRVSGPCHRYTGAQRASP